MKNNLQFVQENLKDVDLCYNQKVSEVCSKENWWKQTYEQLESMINGKNQVDMESLFNTEKEWCYKTLDGKMHWYRVYPVLNGWHVEFPWMYYAKADPVAAKKYVFFKDGNLEKAIICLWDKGIYSLSV